MPESMGMRRTAGNGNPAKTKGNRTWAHRTINRLLDNPSPILKRPKENILLMGIYFGSIGYYRKEGGGGGMSRKSPGNICHIRA